MPSVFRPGRAKARARPSLRVESLNWQIIRLTVHLGNRKVLPVCHSRCKGIQPHEKLSCAAAAVALACIWLRAAQGHHILAVWTSFSLGRVSLEGASTGTANQKFTWLNIRTRCLDHRFQQSSPGYRESDAKVEKELRRTRQGAPMRIALL